jgi:hypothetical protein
LVGRQRISVDRLAISRQAKGKQATGRQVAGRQALVRKMVLAIVKNKRLVLPWNFEKSSDAVPLLG